MIENNNAVLIAGIGGASLGTEILKSLNQVARYTVYGCDISPYAFGHYQNGLADTYLANPGDYVDSVLSICKANGIRAVVPGGEEPMAILGTYADEFRSLGVHLVGNTQKVITTCADKQRLFAQLELLHIPIPKTIAVFDLEQLGDFPCPCVIKPATGTGGSRFVFLASDLNEARYLLRYVVDNCGVAIVQEYVPLSEGEFTIGVLSLPNGKLVGSIAMQRLFHAKLSVQTKTDVGLISSGYSQGLIDEFPRLCSQAEQIARALDSRGPINIQARVRNGVLLPFEINPRFSASTHLRTMAGFNEIDVYLQYVLFGVEPTSPSIRSGYYFRSLSEIFVPEERIKK